ncbi:MAG: ABC transporter ATP-binding protein [Pseudonocardiaceae bacterium]
MLVANRVSRGYGHGQTRIEVLRQVSMDLRPGERVALRGPSGSGKSTLARALALLERPDAGHVELDGEPVHHAGLRLARTVRQRVALLWQSPRTAADPRLTLAQLVAEPLCSGGRRRRPPPGELAAAVALRCEQVGLTGELRERYPHEVSEGQLQRACLARALIARPRYLICDEPTSMLDVSTQAALLETVAEEQRGQDLGVLLITQDQTLAAHWCDRTIELTTAHRH